MMLSNFPDPSHVPAMVLRHVVQGCVEDETLTKEDARAIMVHHEQGNFSMVAELLRKKQIYNFSKDN